MKFAHIADLHIGKRVNDFSMLEEQRYIFKEIIEIIRHEDADAVLVAGDIYDKSQPSAEAVALCDDFFYSLSGLDKDIFIISGNHDCPERIAYGARLLENTKFHIAPVFNGEMKRTELFDEFGKVNVYMLPFVKPVGLRKYIGTADNYTQAVKAVIDKADINQEERNILVAHQFVTGALRCDSEELTVGTLDNVDATVFDKFDYVALGHIHRPQCVGRESIRYSGSPLKYSFSEINHTKSVTIADVGDNDITIKTVPLKPFHDMVHLKGEFKELMTPGSHIFNTDDYIYVTLTDEQDIPDAIGRLRILYPNIMKLDYDNTRTRKYNDSFDADIEQRQEKQPIELFEELYELQNNQQMDNEQREYINHIIEEIWV